jgi:DNA-binding NarL/FixJ family response regulator
MWRGGALKEAPAAIAEPFALSIRGRSEAASEAFAAAGRPYEAALALGDCDDPAAIHRAIDSLDRLGGRSSILRLRQKLRRIGLRGPRPSTRANPSGLTAREVEIVELIDQGLRNADIAERLFVSSKTVDHHVSSILGKLGARSRGEAARIYRSQK